MDHERSLVVGCAAPVEAAVTLGRFERRCLPEAERVGWLHVVMAVNDHVRPTRIAGQTGEHDGVTLGWHHLDGETHRAEQVDHEFPRSPHAFLGVRIGRNARVTDKFLQFLNGIKHAPKCLKSAFRASELCFCRIARIHRAGAARAISTGAAVAAS